MAVFTHDMDCNSWNMGLGLGAGRGIRWGDGLGGWGTILLESPSCSSVPVTSAYIGTKVWPLGSEGEVGVPEVILPR